MGFKGIPVLRSMLHSEVKQRQAINWQNFLKWKAKVFGYFQAARYSCHISSTRAKRIYFLRLKDND